MDHCLFVYWMVSGNLSAYCKAEPRPESPRLKRISLLHYWHFAFNPEIMGSRCTGTLLSVETCAKDVNIREHMTCSAPLKLTSFAASYLFTFTLSRNDAVICLKSVISTFFFSFYCGAFFSRFHPCRPCSSTSTICNLKPLRPFSYFLGRQLFWLIHAVPHFH
jgi:hypothetical protein